MARYSAGVKSTAGSTTLPLSSVYAGASAGCRLRECGFSNTTSTAVDVKLVRLTTTGTQGSGLTEARHDPNTNSTAECSAFTTHSANPTLGDDLGYRLSIGAAVGAGTIWTFGDSGIVIPVGTANGVGLIIENGTGQPLQIDWVWDE